MYISEADRMKSMLLYNEFVVYDTAQVRDTYAFFIYFAFGHSDNYIHANSLITPEHKVPAFYFLPCEVHMHICMHVYNNVWLT